MRQALVHCFPSTFPVWEAFHTEGFLAVYSVFRAKHGNLFYFGAMAQLENKLPLGGHRKGAGYIVSS